MPRQNPCEPFRPQALFPNIRRTNWEEFLPLINKIITLAFKTNIGLLETQTQRKDTKEPDWDKRQTFYQTYLC